MRPIPLPISTMLSAGVTSSPIPNSVRYLRTSLSPPVVNDSSETSPVLLSNTQPVLRTDSSAVNDSVRKPALRHGTPCGRRKRSPIRRSRVITYLRSGNGAE